MNINSGGPHILLFERDQQLVALLTSELQLAGYEVHTARTAVEVFDAIARFPIRLVLVNLAQAQAGRREFWVALDAQRRGRGVQVFTFRCSNIAGYGPVDPDERVQSVMSDLEVDGMSGVMNLVDAVRTRVPGPASAGTTTLSRLAAVSASNGQEPGGLNRISQAVEVPTQISAPPTSMQPPLLQTTVPLPSMSTNSNPSIVASAPAPSRQQYQPPPVVPAPPVQPSQAPASISRPPNPTFTDKIRAVIYPSSRSFSPIPETNWMPHSPGQPNHNSAQRLPSTQRPVEADMTPTVNRETTMQKHLTNEVIAVQMRPTQGPPPSFPATPGPPQESGLDQLSRMLRERETPTLDAMAGVTGVNGRKTAWSSTPAQPAEEARTPRIQANGRAGGMVDRTATQARPVDGTHTLRASPIQDIPFEHIEREPDYRNGTVESMGAAGAQAFPQAEVSASRPIATPPTQVSRPAPSTQPVTSITSSAPATVKVPIPAQPRSPGVREVASRDAGQEKYAGEVEMEATPVAAPVRPEAVPVEPAKETTNEQPAVRAPQLSIEQHLTRRPEVSMTSDDMLLDIVKSLPPMSPASTPPPQSPQPQVLSGRATRSLGSVLLEGHLVPQERLEVAQRVQRMLRGVDLNYQLGEILLMFKLLTPDQLLAASLVSYGMISTVQISALGRIRQELHAMGLEYDLESLVILFRVLTPEQLREVRASWTS